MRRRAAERSLRQPNPWGRLTSSLVNYSMFCAFKKRKWVYSYLLPGFFGVHYSKAEGVTAISLLLSINPSWPKKGTSAWGDSRPLPPQVSCGEEEGEEERRCCKETHSGVFSGFAFPQHVSCRFSLLTSFNKIHSGSICLFHFCPPSLREGAGHICYMPKHSCN